MLGGGACLRETMRDAPAVTNASTSTLPACVVPSELYISEFALDQPACRSLVEANRRPMLDPVTHALVNKSDVFVNKWSTSLPALVETCKAVLGWRQSDLSRPR